MPSTSGPGEHADSLGVRRSVELPEPDIEAAGDLTPAGEPDAEEASGPAASADGGPDAAAVGEPSAETTTEDKPKEAAAPARGIAVAAPPKAAVAVDEMPPDRPKKTVLAGVAIGGAVVLAIPILLIGRGVHHGEKHRTAAAAATVQPGNGQQPGAFTSVSPTVTPSPSASAKKKEKAKPSKSAKLSSSAKHSSSHKAKHRSTANERPSAGGPPWGDITLHSSYDLNPGHTVRTNRIALTMESGGNLVLRNKSNKIIWSSGTHRAGAYAELQTDGNLVVYVNGRQAVWAAGCFGHNNPTMRLQSDGNLVIYDSGGSPIWASNTGD